MRINGVEKMLESLGIADFICEHVLTIGSIIAIILVIYLAYKLFREMFEKLLKNFYIVSAVLYFEKSLTLRIIGVPYVKDKTNELEVRVSKSSCFTREKVEELRLNLQIQANKNFLKFFVAKTKVITADKKKISIRQLGLFENYKENRI